jgi:hypothetical protein
MNVLGVGMSYCFRLGGCTSGNKIFFNQLTFGIRGPPCSTCGPFANEGPHERHERRNPPPGRETAFFFVLHQLALRDAALTDVQLLSRSFRAWFLNVQ